MTTPRQPSRGVMAGAISLMLFCAITLGFIALGAYKAATQPPPAIAWCDYSAKGCVGVCRKKAVTLIYFHATWCPACKKMDETTFADPRVRERLAGYGTVIVDTDKSPAVTERAKVRAMPTIIAMKGCEEAMRVVGALDPDSFLGFLDTVDEIAKEE